VGLCKLAQGCLSVHGPGGIRPLDVHDRQRTSYYQLPLWFYIYASEPASGGPGPTWRPGRRRFLCRCRSIIIKSKIQNLRSAKIALWYKQGILYKGACEPPAGRRSGRPLGPPAGAATLVGSGAGAAGPGRAGHCARGEVSTSYFLSHDSQRTSYFQLPLWFYIYVSEPTAGGPGPRANRERRKRRRLATSGILRAMQQDIQPESRRDKALRQEHLQTGDGSGGGHARAPGPD
jgi:hypothetical protein